MVLSRMNYIDTSSEKFIGHHILCIVYEYTEGKFQLFIDKFKLFLCVF